MIENFVFTPSKTCLSKLDTSYSGIYTTKEEGGVDLDLNKKKLSELQELLYADGKHALLIILQGMDASGKDGIIKHVMSGVNPQGFKIRSFSTPSLEEFKHDYMWRCMKELPERGNIGIFNRSYYEEVLITRVHPEFLNKQFLPNIQKNIKEDFQFWDTRIQDINNFEKYLANNSIHVLKFFLNISKEEQKKRFLKRINQASKNWKFKFDDISERKHWNEYMVYYEEIFNKTSTSENPWYIIPADKKWFSRVAISSIITEKLKSLNIKYPEVSFKDKRGIIEAKTSLSKEK